jgi:hypothetical protein
VPLLLHDFPLVQHVSQPDSSTCNSFRVIAPSYPEFNQSLLDQRPTLTRSIIMPTSSDVATPTGSPHFRRIHMTKSLGSLVFTPVVKALQERYGSRPHYANIERQSDTPARLGRDERAYLGERDTFYMASVGATGWLYLQHRGGPEGGF